RTVMQTTRCVDNDRVVSALLYIRLEDYICGVHVFRADHNGEIVGHTLSGGCGIPRSSCSCSGTKAVGFAGRFIERLDGVRKDIALEKLDATKTGSISVPV